MDRSARGLTILLALAAFAPAAQAQATNLYADPAAGDGDNGTCASPPPADGCTFFNAIATAGPDDSIFVAAGNYDFESSGIFLSDAGMKLIGPGADRATITSSGSLNATLTIDAENVTASGLRITNTALNGVGLQYGPGSDGSVGAGLSVANPNGDQTCRIQNEGSVTLRDSVCAATNPGASFGAVAISQGGAGNPEVNLRNVTAYSTGASASALSVTTAAADWSVSVKNSIVQSVNSNDVSAWSQTPGAVANVDLGHSAFADKITTGVETDTIITEPEDADNVMATPLFTDTGITFHQAAGSPTIDKGSATDISSFDIDGGARLFGSAPDIGADEFVIPAPPGPGGTTPPPPPAAKKCGKKKKLKKGKCVKKKKKKK